MRNRRAEGGKRLGREGGRSKLWALIGLISGTSADGVDGALLKLRESPGGSLGPEILACHTLTYPPELREQVLSISGSGGGTASEICSLNFALGETFARAAAQLARKAGVPLSRADLIGSHGQTIRHIPRETCFRTPYGVIDLTPSTLQLGEPSVIAERTGVTTVANFRSRDMAVGGQGAPLAPYAHELFFRRHGEAVVFLNIGGIANLTYLPPEGEGAPLAFDTGPGNSLLDGAASRLTGGERSFDRGGLLASRGRVHKGLLKELMENPFVSAPPPKSTGREEFGEASLARILESARKLKLGDEDVVATLTAFTVKSFLFNLREFLPGKFPLAEVIVGGGGTHNRTLMRMLREGLKPVPCRSSGRRGVPADHVEAAAFALLAHAALTGRPGNVPSATGAARESVLGVIVPGRNFGEVLEKRG